MDFSNSLAFAQQLDAADKLQTFQNEFLFPQHNDQKAIYFLGNSLGLQPKKTALYIDAVLQQWSHLGVEGFFKGAQPWLSYHDRLADGLAPIVGALPHEVVIMNQLTVNLHLMPVSFYQPEGKRTKILCEARAFPSDQYMLETHLRQRGFDPKTHLVEVEPRAGEALIREADILQTIQQHNEEIALVFWGGVNYYTGQLFNMQAITAAAHKAGALAGFDLAHAAGNVALQLHDWDVDFACWCSYKYLNAGPGAVGAAYIHERYHTDNSLQRFAGWWGYKKETRFLMQPNFQPIQSAEGWALSTPSPLLFAAHQASLDLISAAGFAALCEKSKQLSAYLFFILHGLLKKFGAPVFRILTPETEGERGAQVSILIPEKGKAVFEFLTNKGVYADWREPDVIRVAPVPLYNSFAEVWQFGNYLEQALEAN